MPSVRARRSCSPQATRGHDLFWRRFDMRELEHLILDNMNTAVLLFDETMRLSYINPAGEMLFEVSARSALGQEASALMRCRPASAPQRLKRAMESGDAFTERGLVLLLPESRERAVDCTVTPMCGGAWTGLLIELEQVDRQLRISREARRVAQQQTTAAVVRNLAHEIKNPLGGLRGAAQLLCEELPDASQREYTQVIIEEADRLRALVDRMLGPSGKPHYGPVNIHQVLERVRQLVEAERGGSLRVVRDYDPSLPELWADFNQLIQALLNVANNASRAVGDGGRIVLRSRVLRQYTLGAKRHRLVVRVDVEDNGPGIPEALQERIFLPMVTGGEGGAGLGLAIAQSLVAQHGGLIECRSHPGETCFSIYLPLPE